MSSKDVLEWSLILIIGAFGLGCVVVGLIGGAWSQRRERKRIAAFMLGDSGTMTVADIEEARWRREQQRFDKGGGDNAA